MMITGDKNHNMGSTPFFHEFKKQASFFLKEKIKTARLALTDVTPAEIMTEEATNGNPWAPDTRTMGLISRAAFEVDDYWRIVEILHKRLQRFDRKNWRISYKALIVLDHLLTHGPESVAEEFQSDRDVIREMESFQFIDEKGFNWGLNVRKKSERVLMLLEKGALLKEERDRARKLTRGIKGFGSFSRLSSNVDRSFIESSIGTFGRCNSSYDHYEEPKQHRFSSLEGDNVTQQNHEVKPIVPQTSFKENVVPAKELVSGDLHEWEICMREANPLLGCQKDESKIEYLFEEDHPFDNHEHQTTTSLLSTRDEILKGC